METMRKGTVIFPRASRAQLVDTLSTTLNRKQIMIQIAQDNALTPVELDKLFTQEEQRALEERGFLGPVVEKAPTQAPTLIQDLGATIMAHLEALIDERVNELVEEKVAAIMSSHATIALISQEQRDIMQSLIDEHEAAHDHESFQTHAEVEEAVEEALIESDIANAVKRTINESTIVEDIVDSRIDDIDWEEKVREGLVNILG